MRLVDHDRLASLLLPMLGKRLIEFSIELASRIVGNI